MKDFHGSIGYGEITKGAMTNYFTLCQNISRYIEKRLAEDNMSARSLPFKPEDYELNSKSSFLDIGSGFGKPNFHVAMQIGVRDSLGLEVVPARVCVSTDLLWKFKDDVSKRKRQHEINNLSTQNHSAITEAQETTQ